MLGIAPQAVLHMASLFAAQDVDGASLVQATAISLFFVVMMVVTVAVAILYGFGLYLVRQNRKPWRIFISHHKCSRQLCVTSEDPAQKTGSACNVFLDTDNLRDLTELFNFVRDTETLTILASPGTSASACAVSCWH